MTNEVVLSSALRSNLLSLQRTQSSIDKVQNVLATGLKVSSALDNPQNFFASQSLKNRSTDLTKLLDGIGQSIQTIKAADAGVTSLTKLVEQAQSIADSARDAIGNGAKEAAITGNVDLSKVTSNGATGGLTSVTGIGSGSALNFQIKDKDGDLVDISSAGKVAIATGDSIDQLITKINDLVNSVTGEAVIKAELTSAGKLKITALDGGTFSVAFDYDGTGAGNTGNTGLGGVVATAETAGEASADQSLAAALGFGSIAQRTEAGISGGSQVYTTSVTASNNTKLVSGAFYESGAGTGFAEASDLLTGVRDTENGSTARFASASAGDTSGIVLTINGSKSSAKINIQGTTIQGLVDSINNDTAIGNLVEASYDAETGKFSIAALDASVSTIKIVLDGDATTTTATKADFDFGTTDTYTADAASVDEGETFVLASAASILAQYENDYNTVRDQINDLVEDAGYRGVNLINGDTLETYFNEDRSNKLSTVGQTLNADGLGLGVADFSTLETIEATANEARAGLANLRSFGGTLSNSLSIIQTRETFTKSLVETLNEGSDKLTIADQNEEGAKLLALQTRQQLGVTALSLAAQAQQSVLRLF